MTAPLLGTGIGTPACETYNAACGELTVLLRSSEGGRLWNHPLTLTGSEQTYHLRLEPASNAVWSPNYFTSFDRPEQIKEKLIRKENYQEGVGGALVGVRIVNPPEKFCRPKGIPQPSQLRSIFMQRMLPWHFAVPPSNRWRALKEKPVLWRPISQRRSATTSRRVIFCSSD